MRSTTRSMKLIFVRINIILQEDLDLVVHLMANVIAEKAGCINQ